MNLFEIFLLNIIYLRYGGLDRSDVIPYIFINIGLVALTYTNVSMFQYILICCVFVILSYILSYAIHIVFYIRYIVFYIRYIVSYIKSCIS